MALVARRPFGKLRAGLHRPWEGVILNGFSREGSRVHRHIFVSSPPRAK